ncbi:MAG TPA: GNAT family N-acetyltransferase [Beijerinckiaceae bacterium]|nr:GNAT family N-acetyltransferase [Beijerinckiaceae bacterium]
MPEAGLPVERGYRPGLIGACIALHGLSYAALSGFGASFEARIAESLSEFAGRMQRPVNGLWSVHRGDTLLGTIAIDGEDLGPGKAHLRWFVVAAEARGSGIGRRLLEAALGHCDASGFAAVHLWTFAGLDAACHLYETHGFALVDEKPGAQWGVAVIEQEYRRPHPRQGSVNPIS